MSVLSCEAIKAKGSEDEQGQRVWTVWYRVICDSRYDGPWVAASAAPGRYGAYSFGTEQDLGAFRTGIDAELVEDKESGRVYLVTCTFSSKPTAKPQDANREVDPILLPPEISGDFVTGQVPLERDKDGTAVSNTAGDAFEGLTKPQSSPTLVIAKNFNSVNLAQLADFMDAVNTRAFFGLGARCWRLARAPWQQQFRGSGTPYYRITFEFHANYETWDEKPRNRGWYYKSGTDKLLCTDLKGMPFNRPVDLNAAGAMLAAGSTPIYFDGVGGNPGPIRGAKERDFAALGVPTNL